MKHCRLSLRRPTPGVESNLVQTFIAELAKTLPNRDYALFIEPKMPTGYPDCVLVEYDPASFTSWSRRRHVLSDVEMRVLFCVPPRNGLCVSTVARRVGLSERKAFKVLQSLAHNGDVVCVNENRFCAAGSGVRGVRRIMSVEAKMRDFEKVVDQAAVNRVFANESYVVMPSRVLSPANRESLRTSRVGLYLISQKGKLRRVRGCNCRQTMSSYVSLYFNEWIGWRLLQEGGRHGG